MLGQDQRSRRPATRRTLLPAAGCLTPVAPGGTPAAVAGKQETPSMETAWPDSWGRPDPGGPVDRAEQTPNRFRTKRQLWTYSGLGLETHDSAQYGVGRRTTTLTPVRDSISIE
jgi:hypothetical protein